MPLTCCRAPASAFAWATCKALDAMVHDGLTNPFSGKQMFVEATEVGDELEITRADLDRWALRSHELALKATDEGRLPEEIVSGHDQRQEGRHGRRDRRGARAATRRSRRWPQLPASSARTAAHTAGNSPGVNDAGGALVVASDEWASANGKQTARRDRRPRAVRRRVRLPRPHPRLGRLQGAREGGPEGAGHRRVGDQRGVRLGHAQLDSTVGDQRGVRLGPLTRSACSGSTRTG